MQLPYQFEIYGGSSCMKLLLFNHLADLNTIILGSSRRTLQIHFLVSENLEIQRFTYHVDAQCSQIFEDAVTKGLFSYILGNYAHKSTSR